ncbi:hypothetical protein BC830DRAFT_1129328 [Chytriomyces sp. MP71]|nr:hypothetical protein BC830DRAFT_1129328 [Chytriomyces sp. MP71]
MRTLAPVPAPKKGETLESLAIKHGRSIIYLPQETFSDIAVPNLEPSESLNQFWTTLVHEGDDPADRYVAECFANGSGTVSEEAGGLPRTVMGLKKLMALKELPESTATELAAALGLDRQPEWLDAASVERGQRFMWRMFGLYFTILGHSSLSGGYGVARVDDVLHMTGGITKEATVWFGWWAILKVRFGHTFASRRAMELRKRNAVTLTGDYVPINQADRFELAMTIIVAFQAVVLMALPRLIPTFYGVVASRQDLEDFTQFWRYNAFLLGVTDKANPCVNYMISLRLAHSYNHLFHAVSPVQAANLLPPRDPKAAPIPAEDDKDGGIMAMQFFRYSYKFDPEHAPTFRVAVALARICMGEEYCDAMGIQATNRLDLFRARLKTLTALIFALLAVLLGRAMEKFMEGQANKLHKKLLAKEMKRREKLVQA